MFFGPTKKNETGLPMEIRGHPDWRRTPHVAEAGQIQRTGPNAVSETNRSNPNNQTSVEPPHSSSILARMDTLPLRARLNEFWRKLALFY